MEFTKEQQLVIDTRDRNLLVSAAAGSGKTAVLVERIMRKLTDTKNPVDVDRLLVMTFTKAAAAEMRERLEKRIGARLDEAVTASGSPEISDEERKSYEDLAELLRRQSALLHSATITTIHGFCTGVLRNHFNKIDLDPSFRVAEEGELKLLQNDVIEQVLEDAFETESEDFLQFVDGFAGAKTDRNIEDAVISLYTYSMANPDPKQWLLDSYRYYFCETAEELFQNPAVVEYFRNIQDDIKGLLRSIDLAGKICEESDGPYYYAQMLESDKETIGQIIAAMPSDGVITVETYKEIRDRIQNMAFCRKANKKKDPSVNEDKIEQVSEMRDKWKDAFLKNYKIKEFALGPDEMLANVRAAGESARVLANLTIAFADAYREAKRERGIVDFADLEHLTLDVLYDRDDDGNSIASAQANEYREQFEEIMVDEYQDSNMVQEYILKAVSRDDADTGNLFMVGDVKQSIYGFRLADPSLFAAKLKSYPVIDEGPGEKNARIDLHKNFRSRRQVVDTVNVICRQLMHESIGEVEYDKAAELVQGATYGTGGGTIGTWNAELLLVDQGDTERKQAEATMIAQRIREMIESQMPVQKKDKPEENRPVEYSDIAILLRSVAGWSDIFANTLNEFGIPTIVGIKAGYFDSYEIQAILNYLEVINNPKDDEPLCAALHGPFGMLNDEELAQIRIFHREGTFCEAAEAYLEKAKDEQGAVNEVLYEKVKSFYDRLYYLQEKAEYLPIHELLTEIIAITGYDLMIQAMDGGAQRLMNLTMLLEKAGEFEGISYKGVFHFVRYIRQLRKYEVDYGIPDDGKDAGNAVRIMTIHKSKGLEFPVCFVSGCGKLFNDKELKKELITDDKLGVGLQTVRAKRRTRSSNLLREVMKDGKRRKLYGEELRVLYVALTRAREKLIITGGIKRGKVSVKIAQHANLLMRVDDAEVSPSMIMDGYNYLDWIFLGLAKGIKEEVFKEDLINMLNYSVPKENEEGVAMEPPTWEFEADLGESDNYKDDLNNEAGIKILWSGLDELEDKVLSVQLKKEDRLQFILKTLEESKNCPIESIEKRFSWTYEYGSEYAVPIKFSVSDLKHEAMRKLDSDEERREEESVTKMFQIPVDECEEKEFAKESGVKDETDKPSRPEPEFIKGRNERENIGSERGTAYHRVFELLDYAGDLSYEGIKKQIDGFVERGLMDRRGAELVYIKHICQFAESEIGKRMGSASALGTLRREQPFVYSAPACDLDPKYISRERVLVQGIIDAIFREGEEYVIVDYKTDNVESLQRLADLYREQLRQYKNAIEQITGVHVKACVIYSVKFGCEIEV